MVDHTMVAKTIWLLLSCFSCKFVMAFEGFEETQVCWASYISSIFQQVFVYLGHGKIH
jgi:hypothetical protein